jgi:hypothetical protein
MHIPLHQNCASSRALHREKHVRQLNSSSVAFFADLNYHSRVLFVLERRSSSHDLASPRTNHASSNGNLDGASDEVNARWEEHHRSNVRCQ